MGRKHRKRHGGHSCCGSHGGGCGGGCGYGGGCGGGGRPGEAELFGLVLLVIGVVTVCALLLPSKIWVIILGLLMIFCGYKIFTG